jgi:RNA polymerase sigma-70 factor, ECF subfamily
LQSGDMTALGALLAADVSMHADGGGKRSAAVVPVLGWRHVMRLFRALSVLARKYPAKSVRVASVNGLPGFVTEDAEGLLQTTAFDIEDGKIAAIYIVRNPDKLKHLH